MAKRLGITMRMETASAYPESRDCLACDWARWLARVIPECQWLALPNVGAEVGAYARAWSLDGFILTGGNDIGAWPLRDETERTLLALAVERRLPVLGVCRGLQMIHHFFGGRLIVCDPERHVATRHPVRVIASPAGMALDIVEADVNSFHRQGVAVGGVVEALCAFSVSEDGVAEGIYHSRYPIVAVQWHPEREAAPTNLDMCLARRLCGADVNP